MKEHVDIVSWSKGRDPSERINALEAQEVSVVMLYLLYKRCRLGSKLETHLKLVDGDGLLNRGGQKEVAQRHRHRTDIHCVSQRVLTSSN